MQRRPRSGSTLRLLICACAATGKEETDRISVGLRFAREMVKKRVHYKTIDNSRFSIPPGAPAHPVSAQKTLECDATGIGLFSHMHLRGKDSTFIARYPDGKSETLLALPNYSFNWQLACEWPRGTRHFPKARRLSVSHTSTTLSPRVSDPS